MKPDIPLAYEFVEFIPQNLKERVLYISIPFATAAHRCCCGCGEEVVTPLSPTDWALIYDGETVSLTPSIGSWALPCRSHYWIIGSRAEWALPWSQKQIDNERARDQEDKATFFEGTDRPSGVYSRLRRLIVSSDENEDES